MEQAIALLIKIIDCELDDSEVIIQVRYLIEDLRDLRSLNHVRFEPIIERRLDSDIKVGVRFVSSSDKLESILRRLRDRLFYNPLETLLIIQLDEARLQIETHKYEDLVSLIAAGKNGFLFPPESIYLARVETSSRTDNELSPTKLDNLNLLRHRLGLSQEIAEELNSKAAGLYRTKVEKLQCFERVTQAEFSNLYSKHKSDSFSPKDIWPVLHELAENLGLSIPDAKGIYRDYQKQHHRNIEILEQESAEAHARARQEDKEAKAEADRQQQVRQAQEQRDLYKKLCHQALAKGLYPSEFDQGCLDQARRLRGIAPADAVAIEAAVRDELYGGVASAVGVDYTRLRDLLHQQDWAAADLETEAAILKALNVDMQPVTAATVQRLPAVDLATIDGLWSRYSKGRFGFKAQQQVYRSQQQIQQDDRLRGVGFQQMVAWRDPPSIWSRGFRPYYDLDFSLEAPAGHLPTWRWCCPSLSHRYDLRVNVVEAVMDHLNTCMPLEAVPIPTFDQTLAVGGVASAS